jgi:hypothetical protein
MTDDDDDDVAETDPIGSGHLAHLVSAMNALPGINVLEQQGTAEVSGDEEHLQNAFGVFFDVDILTGGWLSLAKILQAIDNCDDGRDFYVYVAAGDDQSQIIFQLEGDHDADPCRLAHEIEDPHDPQQPKIDDDDEHDNPLLGIVPGN